MHAWVLGLHVCVAFFWSAVFLYGAMRLDAVRRLPASRLGILGAAASYGPLVWLVMSLVVIPLFTHRLPTFTVPWTARRSQRLVTRGGTPAS